ncbi:hypothetical protein [Paludisphaera borealis]|uniref:Uncharacterized protein n=2 Tax=Paludisphaera borealis TaxID=1387353 RepID=A0A1U7CP33_9BACT|nr:hypothetical protein [Paludisphaera borealis]APW60666.1 hypothetical protein BSF38_02153 [Paludisphaera borealis]
MSPTPSGGAGRDRAAAGLTSHLDPEEAFDFMRQVSKIGPTAGILLLGGLVGLAFIARSGEASANSSPLPFEFAPSQAQAAPAAAPAPYFYGAGAQGFGYYVTPGLQAATAAAPVQVAARRPQTVGPGARNWATGSRVPLHRPWLKSRS